MSLKASFSVSLQDVHPSREPFFPQHKNKIKINVRLFPHTFLLPLKSFEKTFEDLDMIWSAVAMLFIVAQSLLWDQKSTSENTMATLTICGGGPPPPWPLTLPLSIQQRGFLVGITPHRRGAIEGSYFSI